jgi:hypothetical protein
MNQFKNIASGKESSNLSLLHKCVSEMEVDFKIGNDRKRKGKNNLLLKLLAVTRCTGMKYLLQKGHAWKHKI